MSGTLPDGEGRSAAKHILLRPVRTGDSDGADDGDAVEDRERAAHGQHAAAVRDHQTAQPGLPRLLRQFSGRHVERRRSVRFVKGELRASRFGFVHASNGDGRACGTSSVVGM